MGGGGGREGASHTYTNTQSRQSPIHRIQYKRYYDSTDTRTDSKYQHFRRTVVPCMHKQTKQNEKEERREGSPHHRCTHYNLLLVSRSNELGFKSLGEPLYMSLLERYYVQQGNIQKGANRREQTALNNLKAKHTNIVKQIPNRILRPTIHLIV